MEQIFGKGVSKGVAAGPISFYRRPSGEIPRRSVTDPAAELARFHDACETAKEQLAVLHDKALAEAGEDAAMLFEAHQMMLDDLDFVESIEGLIENDCLNAEAAVSDTGAQFAEMFAAMDDSYMQARAADIRDISTRVVGILTGEGESGIVSDVPCIVAADDLAPSETVQLDKSLILGFITAGGELAYRDSGTHDGHSGDHRRGRRIAGRNGGQIRYHRRTDRRDGHRAGRCRARAPAQKAG